MSVERRCWFSSTCAHVRRCGAELALIGDRIPIPPTLPLALDPRTLTANEIEAIHAYTNPATAGYQLAKLVTGLPDELLRLIGGDQITDEAILGCPVAAAGARPILRAIDQQHEPVLKVPYDQWPWPSEEVASDEATAIEEEFASALASLLRGRSARILAIKLSRKVRSRFETLRTDGLLDRRFRVYRASHMALYSSYQLATPPIRSLTNDRDDLLTTRGNPTDN